MFALLVVLAVLYTAEVIGWCYRASKANDSGEYTKTWSSGDLAQTAVLNAAMLAAIVVALVFWV